MNEVYFVYDGDCPICQIAARGLKIKKAVGELNLINARDNPKHPVINEINIRGFDLDKGMVIKFKDLYYHGADALHIIALISSDSGWFNRINVFLFRSKNLSRIFYPLMRAARNIVLRVKGVSKINNLAKFDQPIFKTIFGDSWDNLPPVLRKYYSKLPFHNDSVTIIGKMDISFGLLAKLLKPIFGIFGVLVPYQGKNIPVTVKFYSETKSNSLHIDRTFYFPGKPAYYFQSILAPQENNQIIEYMRFGLGLRAKYIYENSKVKIQHQGYVWKIFGIVVPLPITILFGKVYAEEQEISENSFKMMMVIIHSLFGIIYKYEGTFSIKSDIKIDPIKS